MLMAQQIRSSGIPRNIADALQIGYEEEQQIHFVSGVWEKDAQVWQLKALWGKPEENPARISVIIVPAPERMLLDLLEEGISMGGFNAVEAKKEVWDNLTSK
jgi:hypothetical protein